MDFTTKIYSAGGSSTTATPSTTPSKPGEKRKSSRPPAGGPAVNNLYVHDFQVDLLLNAALNNLDVHIQGGFFDCSALKMTKYKEK